MKSHSLAVTLTPPPDEWKAAGQTKPAAPRRRRAASALPRGASSTIRQALEIAGEALWVLLLVLVIGFVVAKAPEVSTAVDEISGASPRPPSSSAELAQAAQIRDLQARFARYESRLVPLERGYARLRQRHADLLKAYAELRKAHVREATSQLAAADPHPVAAP